MRRATILGTAARGAGFGCIVAIVILSLLPGELRPDALSSGQREHFVAYFGTGALLALGYATRENLWTIAILLTLCAAVLETGQLFIPLRGANFADFLAGALGAWAGVFLIVLGKFLWRRAHLE